MDRHPDEQTLPHDTIRRRIDSIKKVLTGLDPSEMHEWKRLQLLKITQIGQKVIEESQSQKEREREKSKGGKVLVVKEHLRILVYVCCDLKGKSGWR